MNETPKAEQEEEGGGASVWKENHSQVFQEDQGGLEWVPWN